MSIYIGDKEINNLYIGDSGVKEVYLGDTKVRPAISLKSYEEIVAMATSEQTNNYNTTYPLTIEELNKYPEEYYNTFDSAGNLTQATISYPNNGGYKRLSGINRSGTGYYNASIYYIDNVRQHGYKTSGMIYD